MHVSNAGSVAPGATPTDVPVITAVPSPTAVTRPFSSTVATVSLSVDQIKSLFVGFPE